MRYILLFCFLALFSYGDTTKERSFSAPEFNVIDLNARRFSEGRILVINGYVKNDSFQDTSGRVVIYIQQGNSTILTLEEVVNKGIPFVHGEKGFFEASTDLEPTQKLDTVLVEYIPTQ